METDQDGQDIRQMFYNNLQLLDFNTTAMEAEHRIQFNKYMFDLPNRRGAELVLHFLFQRLNPTMCKEAFRDSWPIFDKKREQQFRKTCTQWLSNIAQDEADSHLPRVTASLLMSPGGEKFYQLLFFFSGYVLRKVMETELGVKTEDLTRYPSVSGQTQSALGEVQLKAITCSAIRHRKQFVNTVQLNVRASQQWKHSADEFVREHRRLTKQGRELDYKIREEDQRAQQAALSRGSPVKKRSSVEHFDPEFDPKTIKRSQRVQQVRDLWKQVEGFTSSEAAEREVVESIVQRTVNRHRLDGAELAVTVPDLLLRECQEEIRRRNVDNTYKGGKLNIVSVLQLWNLALHLYLEKLRQVGLPQFNGEVDKLTSQAHVQQNYTQKTQTLRHQMAENIPKLKASIGELRSRLDNIFFNEQPAESIRTTVSGPQSSRPAPRSTVSTSTRAKYAEFSSAGSKAVPASFYPGHSVKSSDSSDNQVKPDPGDPLWKRALSKTKKYSDSVKKHDKDSKRDLRNSSLGKNMVKHMPSASLGKSVRKSNAVSGSDTGDKAGSRSLLKSQCFNQDQADISSPVDSANSSKSHSHENQAKVNHNRQEHGLKTNEMADRGMLNSIHSKNSQTSTSSPSNSVQFRTDQELGLMSGNNKSEPSSLSLAGGTVSLTESTLKQFEEQLRLDSLHPDCRKPGLETSSPLHCSDEPSCPTYSKLQHQNPSKNKAAGRQTNVSQKFPKLSDPLPLSSPTLPGFLPQGQSLQSNQSVQGHFLQDNQSGQGQCLQGNQPVQGQSLQSNQPVQGQCLQGNQPVHGQSLQSNQSVQGQYLQGNQPVQGQSLQSNQPVQGQCLQGNQPVQGQCLQGNQPVQGQCLQGNQPVQGQSLQSNQPVQGQCLQGNQPVQGQCLQGNQPVQGQCLQGNQPVQGQSLQSNQSVQGQYLQGNQSVQGQCLHSNQSGSTVLESSGYQSIQNAGLWEEEGNTCEDISQKQRQPRSGSPVSDCLSSASDCTVEELFSTPRSDHQKTTNNAPALVSDIAVKSDYLLSVSEPEHKSVPENMDSINTAVTSVSSKHTRESYSGRNASVLSDPSSSCRDQEINEQLAGLDRISPKVMKRISKGQGKTLDFLRQITHHTPEKNTSIISSPSRFPVQSLVSPGGSAIFSPPAKLCTPIKDMRLHESMQVSSDAAVTSPPAYAALKDMSLPQSSDSHESTHIYRAGILPHAILTPTKCSALRDMSFNEAKELQCSKSDVQVDVVRYTEMGAESDDIITLVSSESHPSSILDRSNQMHPLSRLESSDQTHPSSRLESSDQTHSSVLKVSHQTSPSSVTEQSNHTASGTDMFSQLASDTGRVQTNVRLLGESGCDDNGSSRAEYYSSPRSGMKKSLGIGLVEPSPKQSFSPSDTVTPSSGVRVPALQEYVVDTPEASRQISEQMELRARRNLQHNFAEPSVGSLKTGVSSGIPKADSMKPGARPSSRPTSARSTTSSRGSSASVKSTPRSSKSDTRQQQQRKQQQPKQQPNGGQRAVSSSSFSHPEVSTPRTAVADISVGDSFTGTSHKPSIHHDEEILGESFQSLNASCDSKASSKQSDGDRTLTEKSSPRSSSSRTPRSPRVKGEGHQRSERRSAADLLVDEIMGEGKILSPFNSGMEAFETRAVVNRTPDLEENTNNPALSPIRGALETAGDAPSSLADVNTELSDVRGGLDRIKDALANVKGELEKATVGNSEFELENAEGPGTPNNSERGDQLDETITPPNSPRGEGADNIGDVIATPPNSVDQGEEGGVSGRNEDDDNQIVNVLGPELDDIEAPVSTGNDAATVSFEDILARAKKVLGPKYLAESDGKKVDLEQELFNEDSSVPNKVDSVSAQLEDIQDNVVDTLIQEGIRQATDEAYDDDDTPGVNIEASHAGYDHQGVDGDDFVEEIQGPELDDDYNDDDVEQNDDDDDDAGSVRSTEELIVIDKSLHMSPTSPRQQGVRTPVDVGPLDSLDADLEDEQFPAIIIDRSFQFTPVTRSGATCSPGRDRLSQSLATDQRSPLSEEIRQMFRKAVAETPSRRAYPKETDADSELELPNMNPLSRCGNKDDDTKQRQHLQQQLSHQQGGLSQADPSWQLSDQQGRLSQADPSWQLSDQQGDLSQADPSWQLSDNLDDVEFPNIRLVEDNDLEPGGQGHTAGILDLDESDFKLETDTNTSITEARGALGHDSDEDELDDFFARKAKELGRKFVDDLGSDEENRNVLGSSSSPRFGLLEDNSDKDESPLISLSP